MFTENRKCHPTFPGSRHFCGLWNISVLKRKLHKLYPQKSMFLYLQPWLDYQTGLPDTGPEVPLDQTLCLKVNKPTTRKSKMTERGVKQQQRNKITAKILKNDHRVTLSNKEMGQDDCKDTKWSQIYTKCCTFKQRQRHDHRKQTREMTRKKHKPVQTSKQPQRRNILHYYQKIQNNCEQLQNIMGRCKTTAKRLNTVTNTKCQSVFCPCLSIFHPSRRDGGFLMSCCLICPRWETCQEMCKVAFFQKNNDDESGHHKSKSFIDKIPHEIIYIQYDSDRWAPLFYLCSLFPLSARSGRILCVSFQMCLLQITF